MTTLRQSFRRWWQPPRRAVDREVARSVTFLELFHDLVYVVIVAELSHTLAGNVTAAGVAGFAFLFFIVWWAWFNGSIYHDTHGNNDMRTRVFTFLQIFTIAAMAVFAHNALGAGAAGFALSYAAFQLILTYLWWRTGVHDPDHRPLSQPYAAVFLLNTLLFAVSAFIPAPFRFYLWAVAVLLSLLLPVAMFRPGTGDPAVRSQTDRLLHVSPALVERFGLLTIIVLGEVVVGTVGGVVAQETLSWIVGITAVLGLAIATGLWWMYFDFVSQRHPRATLGVVLRWSYLHLPMTAGITATGAAVTAAVAHAGGPLPAGVHWLLVGAVALALLCIALLLQAVQVSPELAPLYRHGGLLTAASAMLILLLGPLPLPAIPLMTLQVLLLLLPVFYGIKVWILVLGAAEQAGH